MAHETAAAPASTRKPWRTDEVGSMIRPSYLLDARGEFKSGTIGREQLRAVEDRAVQEVIDLQHQAGMDIFGDGEFRRDSYQSVMSEAVDGFAAEYPYQEDVKPDGTVVRIMHHSKPIVSKIRTRGRMAAVDAAFLKEHAPGPFKITLISPAFIQYRSYKKGVTDAAYPDPEEMLADVVDITINEMTSLVDQGTPYIQLDMGFARYVLDSYMEGAKADGVDLDREIRKDIETENKCYAAARRNGATFGMHICRGNRNAFNHGRGNYEWVSEHIFEALDVDRFLLEYDTDRAGGFEPLRHLPKGKIVVLGLISTKSPELESVDGLRRRIDEAARFCSYDQLALSPQCGFQGGAVRNGQHMSIDDEKRKLELVVETARRVWS